MSSTKKESREEANEDSEEQDVTEAGRVFQRIEQEGRKDDRWAEVEHKGTSIMRFRFSQAVLTTGGCRGELILQTGRTQSVEELPEEE